jgi:hypothetical protein
MNNPSITPCLGYTNLEGIIQRPDNILHHTYPCRSAPHCFRFLSKGNGLQPIQSNVCIDNDYCFYVSSEDFFITGAGGNPQSNGFRY